MSFQHHAVCDDENCTFELHTDDYEMRGVLVGQHRIKTGHSVTMKGEDDDND